MISIIIPLKADQGYLRPCVDACLRNIKGTEFQIIILPDDELPFEFPDSRIQIRPTGPISPSRKRNLGVENCRGEILAFIDDDTKPLEGWLEAALQHFNADKIAAVGGPSITPSSDSFWAQVSGAVYETWMLSGSESYRYRQQGARDVDDFPSCNLLVRKSVFQKIGGFGTDFWPGEDTELCLKIIKEGHRIRYEPGAMIEHHRRPSIKKHLVQLGNYALHRGYFVKRYPETSCRFLYFVPTLCVLLGIALSIGAMTGSNLSFQTLLIMSGIYVFLNLVSVFTLKNKTLGVKAASIFIIFLSHVVYGIFFARGLLATRLPEEKR